MTNKSVSIVMTYYEREEQLKNTLLSFAYHGYDENVEVIVIDDGSIEKPAVKPDFNYSYKLSIFYLDPKKKWYKNSCVPYNYGFSKCNSDIVIIQNAECMHLTNIIDYVRGNLSINNYFSFGCYSIDKDTYKSFSFTDFFNTNYIQARAAEFDGDSGWYNHSSYRPLAYHFCSAITRIDLDKLYGFDQRYAKGIGFDDNELVFRIRENEIKISFIDEQIVIHQWHYTNPKSSKKIEKLKRKNELIYKYATVEKKPLLMIPLLYYYSLIANSTQVRKIKSKVKMLIKVIK